MNDKKYSLDFDNPEIRSFIAHFRKNMMQKDGCRINEGGETAIVYNAELAAFLHIEKFPTGTSDAAKTINGYEYRGSYIDGFSKGQEYFTEKFGLPPGVRYLQYDPKYRADLHLLYNNLGHKGYDEGWSFVKLRYPVLISHEIIKEWGFYGGIVFKYENLLKEHPSLELSDNESNYILKKESIIHKLFEDYGAEFPDELKELWEKRWINGDNDLPPIIIDEFKIGNNKHLLLTILHEAHPYLKINNFDDYVKKRWGLKSYHSDVSRYIINPDAKPHPETRNISSILKSESL